MSDQPDTNPTRLVRLHNALVSARCAMSAPRMDADKQARDAIDKVLAAFDRPTERALRYAVEEWGAE